jgi:multidrug efflux system membrane fusion protein
MSGPKKAMFVLGGALALLNACTSQNPYEKLPVPVSVSTVQVHTGGEGVRYSANIEARTRVDLAFKVGGYIERLRQVREPDGQLRNVQEGDMVERQTVLAEVRQNDYREKLAEAKSKVAEAQAVLQKASQDFDRANRLFASQSITKPEFDGAKAQFDAAQAREQGAQALVEEAQIALRDTSLRSPLRGVVLKGLVEVGSLVGPGTSGFSLADTSSVKVVYGVPDTLVQKAKLGSAMTIATEAVPGRMFHGRITAIAPNADARSRLFNVEITVPNPNGLLKVGMIASLEVPDGQSGVPVNVVPISAIVRSKTESAGYAVFVVETRGEEQVARIREVKLGEAYGNLIAVTSGVNRGEAVIVVGATLVVDGQKVRVIP